MMDEDNDPSARSLRKALQMFEKPISLQHVTKKKKRPMQEVQKIAFLLLKHNILKEKVRRFVLKLPSSLDIKQT